MRSIGTPTSSCQIASASSSDSWTVTQMRSPSNPQPPRRRVARDEVPAPRDGRLLEVVAEAEVAEHLEEHEVTLRAADVVEVVVLAAGAGALLRADGPLVRRLLVADEVRLERHHAGHVEQHRRIVRDQARRGHERVALRREEARGRSRGARPRSSTSSCPAWSRLVGESVLVISRSSLPTARAGSAGVPAPTQPGPRPDPTPARSDRLGEAVTSGHERRLRPSRHDHGRRREQRRLRGLPRHRDRAGCTCAAARRADTSGAATARRTATPTAHFRSTSHPIVQSFEPGEEWLWCYVDEIALRVRHRRAEPRPPVTPTRTASE